MNPPADNPWPAAADAVGVALAVSRWPDRVRNWLEREGAGTGPWCVALSGGADSVALLLALVGLGNVGGGVTLKPRPSLVALHFNHRLRGADADADEVFCREMCAALNVELRVGRADWPQGREVSEGQARDARFAFFKGAMADVGSRVLWLGHHRDDVVETMLIRLGRGSGSRGLAAPRPVQRLVDGTVRVRPLLDLAKAAIVEVLRAAGVSWREDRSNHGDAYLRNRLRRNVVPAWRMASPSGLDGPVARSRSLLEEDDEALEQWVDQVMPAVEPGRLDLLPVRNLPVAVVRRVLHRWLMAQDLDGELSSVAFDGLLESVMHARSTMVSVGSGFLSVGQAELCFKLAEAGVPAWASCVLTVPGSVPLPTGSAIRAQVVSVDEELRAQIVGGAFDHAREVYLDAGENPSDFLLRQWREGDRYQPLGAAGSSKLQDQFVNRRIPRELRRLLPVVCDAAGSILWVPGIPPAHQTRVREGTTRAVQLTYIPTDSLCATSHGR